MPRKRKSRQNTDSSNNASKDKDKKDDPVLKHDSTITKGISVNKTSSHHIDPSLSPCYLVPSNEEDMKPDPIKPQSFQSVEDSNNTSNTGSVRKDICLEPHSRFDQQRHNNNNRRRDTHTLDKDNNRPIPHSKADREFSPVKDYCGTKDGDNFDLCTADKTSYSSSKSHLRIINTGSKTEFERKDMNLHFQSHPISDQQKHSSSNSGRDMHILNKNRNSQIPYSKVHKKGGHSTDCSGNKVYSIFDKSRSHSKGEDRRNAGEHHSNYQRSGDKTSHGNSSGGRSRSKSSGRDKRSKSDESRNRISNYDHFKRKYIDKDQSMDFKIVDEVQGDLFTACKEYSLGHCVAEDMKMGSGIAVLFRQIFQRVPELLDQRRTQGQVAIINDEHRFIYYLVTKQVSNGKPTYLTMWSSLQRMKEHIIQNGVHKLALPRIGCGLDRLEWQTVKNMLEYIFQDVDIDIKIYNFQQDLDVPGPSAEKKHTTCKVVQYPHPICDIESGTIIVYFGSEDRHVGEDLETICTKYPYVKSSYLNSTNKMGECVYTDRCSSGYVFYGCIVRKSHKEPINYVNLQKCLGEIQKQNRKLKFGYIAFQGFLEDGADMTVIKIVNIMSHTISSYVEIYVCWK